MIPAEIATLISEYAGSLDDYKNICFIHGLRTDRKFSYRHYWRVVCTPTPIICCDNDYGYRDNIVLVWSTNGDDEYDHRNNDLPAVIGCECYYKWRKFGS